MSTKNRVAYATCDPVDLHAAIGRGGTSFVLLDVSTVPRRGRYTFVICGPRRSASGARAKRARAKRARAKRARACVATIEKQLVEELARVFWHPDDATTFLWHAGFPSQSTPAFWNPRVFWTRVMREIANGALAGGIAVLARAAKHRYPSNRVFERCVRSIRSAYVRRARAAARRASWGHAARDRLRAGWRAVRRWRPWTWPPAV